MHEIRSLNYKQRYATFELLSTLFLLKRATGLQLDPISTESLFRAVDYRPNCIAGICRPIDVALLATAVILIMTSGVNVYAINIF